MILPIQYSDILTANFATNLSSDDTAQRIPKRFQILLINQLK